MITLTDLGTPFDDVDSPTTVATPSCCCCCCCCITSISSATVLAGRVVRKDALESQAAAVATGADVKSRGGLIALACLVPIGAISTAVLFGNVLQQELPGNDAAVWFSIALAAVVGAAVLGALRLTAGATNQRAFGSSAVMMLLFPIAVAAEVVAVLFSIGLFWLTTPLWIIWVVRATRFEPDQAQVQPVGSSPAPPPTVPGENQPLAPPLSFPPRDDTV